MITDRAAIGPTLRKNVKRRKQRKRETEKCREREREREKELDFGRPTVTVVRTGRKTNGWAFHRFSNLHFGERSVGLENNEQSQEPKKNTHPKKTGSVALNGALFFALSRPADNNVADFVAIIMCRRRHILDADIDNKDRHLISFIRGQKPVPHTHRHRQK